MTVLKNPEQIEFIMQDETNKDHKISVLSLSRKRIKQFQDEIVNNKEISANDMIVKQLAFFTGKEESFFDIFDIRVLTNSVSFITKEMQRPFVLEEKSIE